MTGWVGDIAQTTRDNIDFRDVLFTAAHVQLVVMSLPTGEEIGVEMHDHVEQYIRVESGRATVTLGPSRDVVSETHALEVGGAVMVPGGTWHNVINSGDDQLKLSTLYSPPEHPAGTVHHTKADAVRAETH